MPLMVQLKRLFMETTVTYVNLVVLRRAWNLSRLRAIRCRAGTGDQYPEYPVRVPRNYRRPFAAAFRDQWSWAI
jgi:hypothetical protein